MITVVWVSKEREHIAKCEENSSNPCCPQQNINLRRKLGMCKIEEKFLAVVIYLVSENMMFQDQPSSWSVVGLCVCHFCFTFGFRISVSIQFLSASYEIFGFFIFIIALSPQNSHSAATLILTV